MAALIKINPPSENVLGSIHVIELTSGKDRRFPISPSREMQDGTMVWSPDGCWLFVVTGRTLYTVDAATSHVRDLGVRLPQLTQLAVRP